MLHRWMIGGAGLALLAACNGPRPAGNDQAVQPPAVEQANVTVGPVANEAANEAVSEARATEPRTCEAEIGKEAAIELAKRCRFVSPATHPPCHPANPCRMIQEEIDRSCAMLGDDQPPECKSG